MLSYVKLKNNDNYEINSHSDYKDGVEIEEEVFYNDDRTLTLKAEYNNGKEHGKVEYYNEDGI